MAASSGFARRWPPGSGRPPGRSYSCGTRSSRSGSPPSMKSRAPTRVAAAMRRRACSPALGWRPSKAPTRTAKTMSYGSSPGSRTKSSIATRRTLMRPEAISSAAAVVACAMAEADRSMARTWPVTRRAATARAAAPGPHPISRTRECGCTGSASTIAASRGDRGGTEGPRERASVGDSHHDVGRLDDRGHLGALLQAELAYRLDGDRGDHAQPVDVELDVGDRLARGDPDDPRGELVARAELHRCLSGRCTTARA